MSVEHYPKNATVKIPVDVVLFDGTTKMTGESGNITVRFLCLDSGHTFDFADSTFRASPGTPSAAVSAFSGYGHDYYYLLDPTPAAWKRGHYRALFEHAPTGRQFAFDFTLGLVTQRGLGVSAAYDGATLRGTVWVEEFGEAQSDYTSLTNVLIVNSNGDTIVNVGTLTTQFDGNFSFAVTAALDAVTQYVLKATAVVSGYQATPYNFKLRSGLVRP